VGCFLGSKTAACGDSGDLRVLVAGMKEGAFGDSDFFSAARVSEANLVASGESGLWALSTLCFAGMKVAAVGESGAEIDEVREVDECGWCRDWRSRRNFDAHNHDRLGGNVSGTIGRHGFCVRKSLVRLSWAWVLWLVVERPKDCAVRVDISLSRPANIRTSHS
jgi:hypothetical protein